MIAALVLALALGGCKGDEQKPADASKPTSEAKPGEAQTASETGEAQAPTATTLERLFDYLPGDALSVAYDRLAQRLDPDVVEVVFALPPKTADLLDEREMLDEGLDITLDGDADPSNWLAATSLGFTLPMGNTPYFLRPLTKPPAEVATLLEQGFHKTEAEGLEVWLPNGSFPWRVTLLDGDIAAFIPIDVVGTGVEPLLAARELEHSEVEDQLTGVLGQDPLLELVLISAQPLVHFDVDQTIAQVQFGLRRMGQGYEGQVVLAPTGDIDECVEQLRARKHPEENQQVQALIGAVEFVSERGGVVGRLAIQPDQLKHFLDL